MQSSVYAFCLLTVHNQAKHSCDSSYKSQVGTKMDLRVRWSIIFGVISLYCSISFVIFHGHRTKRKLLKYFIPLSLITVVHLTQQSHSISQTETVLSLCCVPSQRLLASLPTCIQAKCHNLPSEGGQFMVLNRSFCHINLSSKQESQLCTQKKEVTERCIVLACIRG